jgi:glycosyl transferase family 25
VRAYVINLARSADRRAHVTAGLGRTGLDFEIVTAVDAAELDFGDPQTAARLAPSFFDRFRPGEAACALSHASVHRKILADGPASALVLEDDVTVPPGLAEIAEAVAARLDGAEVALLNFDSAEVVRVTRDGAIELPGGGQLVFPVDVAEPVSGAAYIITRQACERMAKLAVPIATKADDWAYFHQVGAIDRLRCVYPLAVRKAPEFGSTMGYYSDASVRARALALVGRYDLGLVKRAVAYRRERIWRKYRQVEFVDAPAAR